MGELRERERDRRGDQALLHKPHAQHLGNLRKRQKSRMLTKLSCVLGTQKKAWPVCLLLLLDTQVRSHTEASQEEVTAIRMQNIYVVLFIQELFPRQDK